IEDSYVDSETTTPTKENVIIGAARLSTASKKSLMKKSLTERRTTKKSLTR
ncbi:hypothetical protein FCV25MIE_17213, partial [Fagus crenata]